jgi:hypothetical protein
MDQLQKQALQVTKEIVVKFIEVGRISPNNFPEFFSLIYEEILKNISSPLPEQTRDSGSEN